MNMLPEQKKIIRKLFRDIVHSCDLQTIMWKLAKTEDVITQFMQSTNFETNRLHNNRLILFRLLELESNNIFNKFTKTLRENDYSNLANKLENKPQTNKQHKTCCFKLPDEVVEDLPNKSIISTQSLKIKLHKRNLFNDDGNAYRTRSKNRGYVLIINNIHFTTHQNRQGAEVDESNLQELFEKMGFTIFMHRDLTKDEMEDKIEKFVAMDNCQEDGPDIGLLLIMSHGEQLHNKTLVIGSDDKGIEEGWIIKQFNNQTCKIFRKKPKILIFHICRGELVDNLVLLNQHTENDSNCTKKPENADDDDRHLTDLLICHPSLEGFQAHRDTLRGCWYIELLCKVFMENAFRLDVESMLKLIEDHLKYRISEKKTRQTSTYLNISFRTCYLNPGIYEHDGKLTEYTESLK